MSGTRPPGRACRFRAVLTGGGGDDSEAVYRGRMLSTGQYAAFADALAARSVALRTSPAQHRRAHELPG
jgi:hypothetical protein